MNVFEERYVRIIVNSETYYCEIGEDNELGARIAEDKFNTLILNAVYSDIVTEEFLIDLVQVKTIIDRMPNIHDGREMNEFYNSISMCCKLMVRSERYKAPLTSWRNLVVYLTKLLIIKLILCRIRLKNWH